MVINSYVSNAVGFRKRGAPSTFSGDATGNASGAVGGGAVGAGGGTTTENDPPSLDDSTSFDGSPSHGDPTGADPTSFDELDDTLQSTVAAASAAGTGRTGMVVGGAGSMQTSLMEMLPEGLERLRYWYYVRVCGDGGDDGGVFVLCMCVW